jgi:hypothetical protein
MRVLTSAAWAEQRRLTRAGALAAALCAPATGTAAAEAAGADTAQATAAAQIETSSTLGPSIRYERTSGAPPSASPTITHSTPGQPAAKFTSV